MKAMSLLLRFIIKIIFCGIFLYGWIKVFREGSLEEKIYFLLWVIFAMAGFILLELTKPEL